MAASCKIASQTRKRPSERGQALAELIIASGVLGIVLMGIVTAINFSLRSTAFATNKTLSVHYAQQGLEKARAARDQNWSVFESSYADPGIAGNTIFTRTTTVTNVPGEPDARKVTSKVTWNDGETERSTEVSTVLGKP